MNASGHFLFDHEKLAVYQEAIAFIAWLSCFWTAPCEAAKLKISWTEHPPPWPEYCRGQRQYALKDRCRFFDIAHGSPLECAAGLDVLVAKGKCLPDQIRPGKSASEESSKCSSAYSKSTPPAPTTNALPPDLLLLLLLLQLSRPLHSSPPSSFKTPSRTALDLPHSSCVPQTASPDSTTALLSGRADSSGTRAVDPRCPVHDPVTLPLHDHLARRSRVTSLPSFDRRL